MMVLVTGISIFMSLLNRFLWRQIYARVSDKASPCFGGNS